MNERTELGLFLEGCGRGGVWREWRELCRRNDTGTGSEREAMRRALLEVLAAMIAPEGRRVDPVRRLEAVFAVDGREVPCREGRAGLGKVPVPAGDGLPCELVLWDREPGAPGRIVFDRERIVLARREDSLRLRARLSPAGHGRLRVRVGVNGQECLFEAAYETVPLIVGGYGVFDCGRIAGLAGRLPVIEVPLVRGLHSALAGLEASCPLVAGPVGLVPGREGLVARFVPAADKVALLAAAAAERGEGRSEWMEVSFTVVVNWQGETIGRQECRLAFGRPRAIVEEAAGAFVVCSDNELPGQIVIEVDGRPVREERTSRLEYVVSFPEGGNGARVRILFNGETVFDRQIDPRVEALRLQDRADLPFWVLVALAEVGCLVLAIVGIASKSLAAGALGGLGFAALAIGLGFREFSNWISELFESGIILGILTLVLAVVFWPVSVTVLVVTGLLRPFIQIRRVLS